MLVGKTATSWVIDMFVSAALLMLLCILDRIGLVDAPFLLARVAAYSLTSPLSASGIRVLIPQLVPEHALAMANALDTGSCAVIEVLGPALAGGLFALTGPAVTMLIIASLCLAVSFTLVSLIRGHQPWRSGSSPRLFAEAATGISYVARHLVLRGLAACYSLYHVSWGVLLVTVPVFVGRQVGLVSSYSGNT